jgi:hypothetical protein
MTAIGAAVDAAGRSREANAAGGRPNRQTGEEVRALKARDNVTNWLYLARIYLGRPTALGVLGAAHAPKTQEEAYVDNSAIEYADVRDAAGIAREVEESLRRS